MRESVLECSPDNERSMCDYSDETFDVLQMAAVQGEFLAPISTCTGKIYSSRFTMLLYSSDNKAVILLQKREARAVDNWKSLVKGLLIRQRLRSRYDLQVSASRTGRFKRTRHVTIFVVPLENPGKHVTPGIF